MIKKTLFGLLILFSFFNSFSQDLKIGIVQVNPLPKGIFPVVFYQDSISEEYIEKFMLINGKFIKRSFCRPTELEKNFNMIAFFTFFKESVNEADKIDEATPIIEVFLTDGMNKIDSIQLYSTKHADLVFGKTLDRCFANIQRNDYDKILLAIKSIQSTYSPKYFEVVK